MPYSEFTLEDINFKKTRVVKISSCCDKKIFNKVKRIVNKQINNKDKDIVKVYSWKPLLSYKGYYKYKYSMDRLLDIEKEDRQDICRFTYNRDRDSYNNKKLFDFLMRADKKGYRDIHDQNIMTDKKGNYKLIDLEGFIHNCYF